MTNNIDDLDGMFDADMYAVPYAHEAVLSANDLPMAPPVPQPRTVFPDKYRMVKPEMPPKLTKCPPPIVPTRAQNTTLTRRSKIPSIVEDVESSNQDHPYLLLTSMSTVQPQLTTSLIPTPVVEDPFPANLPIVRLNPNKNRDLIQNLHDMQHARERDAERSRLSATLATLARTSPSILNTGSSSWYKNLAGQDQILKVLLEVALRLHQYCAAMVKLSPLNVYVIGELFWRHVDLCQLDESTKNLLLAVSKGDKDCAEVINKTKTVAEKHFGQLLLPSKFEEVLLRNERKKNSILKKNAKKMKKYYKNMLKIEKENIWYKNGKRFWKTMKVKNLARNYKLALLLLKDLLTKGDVHSIFVNVYAGNTDSLLESH